MKPILQVFYSIFSGVLLSLAIPNEIFLLGCPFFAFIAIIPYYKAIKECNCYKQAFLCGFLQTITTHLISSFWLAYFKDFAIFTLGASAAATGVIGGILSLALYLPYSRKANYILNKYSLSQKFYENPLFNSVYFAIIYTLYEWVKSTGFLGYPWGTISSTMYHFPILMQLASITGTYGITFVTVLFNTVLFELLTYLFSTIKTSLNRYYVSYAIKTYLALFIPIMIFGFYEYNLPRTPIKKLTAILVQQNYDPWKQKKSNLETILASEKLSLKEIDKLNLQNKKAQLVVWSEGSLIKPFPSSKSYYNFFPEEFSLTNYIRQSGTPLLTGGAYVKTINSKDGEETRRYYNAALMFNKNGEYLDFYGKLHLVPFAELIPGIEKPFIKKIMKKVVGISAGWSIGEHLTYFDVECTPCFDKESYYVKNIDVSEYSNYQNTTKVRIATPICFDDAFTDAMRPLFLNGAELFINLTDDSWSLKKSSEYQHFVIASYKAIEYRTTLVRSTNAGYSVVVNPNGKVIADQPLFEECAMSFDIPIYNRVMTTYALLGNWVPCIFTIFFVLFCFYMKFTFTTTDYIKDNRNKKIKV